MEEKNTIIGPAQDISDYESEKLDFISQFKAQHPDDLIIDLDELEDSSAEEEEAEELDFYKEVESNPNIVDIPEAVEKTQKIRAEIEKKWKNLVFRRVNKVLKYENDIVWQGVKYYYIIRPEVLVEIKNALNSQNILTINELKVYMEEYIRADGTYAAEYDDILDKMEDAKFTNPWQVMDFYGTIMDRRYNTLKDALAEVPVHFHHNLEIEYDKFYGFTGTDSLNNDPYVGQQIKFDSNKFAEISFDPNRHFLDFDPTTNHLFAPRHANPRKKGSGQLLCGLVEKDHRGYKFEKWFICSLQFYKLWLMLFDPKNPQLAETLQEQIKDLSTLKIWNLYSMSMTQRLEKYDRRIFETPAMEYGDRYQILANFCFDPNYILQWENKIADRFNYNKIHTFHPIAPFYEEKVLTTLKTLATLIEPKKQLVVKRKIEIKKPKLNVKRKGKTKFVKFNF